MLPKVRVTPPKAPPIKIQGIKTKLVPLIEASVDWDGLGRWIEPFMGSASVALNVIISVSLFGTLGFIIIPIATSEYPTNAEAVSSLLETQLTLSSEILKSD